jgi:uncharacterized membrane protein YccC
MASALAAALVREGRGRHGAQLALAVLAAYAVSASLGLPESLWAVMSALIVVRPNTGTTLSAGWTRLAGTVFGTLAGIAWVWLRHHGASLPVVTLCVVASLAFASAVLPLFASAPIAALIVLSSTAIPGHSVLQVAGLRGIEVGIGVLTGMLVSLVLRGAGATARFDAACSALLRRLAAMLDPGEGAGAAETEIRTKLRELAVLAAGADTEARWLRRSRVADRHRKLAGLMARVFQDVAVLGRLLPGDAAEPARRAALAALEQAADASTPQSRIDAATRDSIATALAAPLQLLLDDLRLLARLRT